MCDRLAFLGQGGNLCYYGPFEEACQFFGLANGDFADAYIQLANKQAVVNTAQRYQQSSCQRQYVEQRLGINTSTQITAKPSKAQASVLQANTALPVLLLPQIIFSGVLFKIQGVSQYFSWLMISRWSVEAYGALVDINHLIPAPQILADGTPLESTFKPNPVYAPSWSNLILNWELLLI